MSHEPVPVRLALLETASRAHEGRLSAVEDRVDKAESRLDVIGAKLGVYAAIGAAIGGGLVAFFLHLS